MKWSNSLGLTDAKENAYNYGYDAMNRILRADFRQKKSTWGLPEYKEDRDGDGDEETYTAAAYSEEGYEYDLNGNIQKLKRKTAKGADLDVLTYDYGAGANQSNKLISITDTDGDKAAGFIDGNIDGTDYTYDANGSMIGDLNKNISAITYNYLNLPSKIVKSSGDYVVYTYDATGRKLRQQVFNSAAVQQKRSDYIGEYFYENDTLKFINHEEGRIVIAGTAPEYQYFLKDHLGNVRMTFTTKRESELAVATMEDTSATAESEQFLNYDEAVKVYSTLFDHTNDGLGEPQTGPNSDPDVIEDTVPGYAVLLRGSHPGVKETYGLAKSLSVMPGDTVKMEVLVKYIRIANKDNVVPIVNSVLSSINAGPLANGAFIDGGIAGSLGAAAFPFAGYLNHTDELQGDAPKAYLSWLVFDRNFQMKNAGFRRVTSVGAETGNGLSQHDYLAADVIIQEAGYVYIYLSNEDENPVDVFFDDFRVEQVKGPVVQMEDYYPFGLTFGSYMRENSIDQRFLFNGKEIQREVGVDWIDYGARMYMIEIGKWGVIDPLAFKYNSWSPYNYALSNPVILVDPDGSDVTYYGIEAQRAFIDLKIRSAIKDRQKSNDSPIGPNRIYVQVLGNATKEQKTAYKNGIDIFNDQLSRNHINAKAELHYSNEIIAKNDFYANNDRRTAYILLGSAKGLQNASVQAEKLGWERIYGDGSNRDFSALGGDTPEHDLYAFVNIDKTNRRQMVEFTSKGVVWDGYSNSSERLSDYIKHEHTHIIYSRNHFPGTIIQHGNPHKGLDYNDDMLKKLRNFYRINNGND